MRDAARGSGGVIRDASGAPASAHRADRLIRGLRRRRPHLALAAALAGLAGAPLGAHAVVIASLAAAGVGAIAFGRRGCLIAAALVVGAGWLAAERITAIDSPARAAPPGAVIQATATILDTPRATRFGAAATLKIETGPARGLRVFARADRGDWPAGARPGMRVALRGLVLDPSRTRAASARSASAPSAANAGKPGSPGYGPLPAAADPAGSFDFAAFLRSRGIGRELKVEWTRRIGRRGGIAGSLDSIRRRAESALGTGLPPDLAALARGMVLGDDAGIDPDMREDFQRSGLAHLLAASGANVALLCALALPLLMAARAGPRARVVTLLALVVLYVPLAGSGASVQRAGIMAAAGLVALAAGRPGSTTYALLLAAAITLAVNPRATGDPGWQLSFAAVAGMLALTPRMRRLLRRVPRPAAEALGATLSATLATAPLMAHQFGAISLAALPANLVALPVVAPIMWIGMGEVALAQLAPLGHLPSVGATAVSRAAAALDGLALRWVAGTASRFATPGWSQAAIHLSWPLTAAAYAGVAAMVIAAVRLAGRPRTRRAAAVLGVAVVAATAGAAMPPPLPPRFLTVDYLDVGQGDATLIRDPAGGAVLFDGGPPEARVDRLLHRLGVRRLSAVVATHQSRDHHGGLLQVVRRFPVSLFLDGGDGTRDPTFTALEREVDRRGIRRIPTRSGERLRIGAMTIRILWPGPRAPGPPSGDANLRATVAIVSEHGFDLFLSADAESQVLLPLSLPRIDAMKVPHHGSTDAGLPQLLARLRPRVAAIEVGRGNDYGHPRPSTLGALRRAVPYVYRTDRDGTVELTVERGVIRIRTHR